MMLGLYGINFASYPSLSNNRDDWACSRGLYGFTRDEKSQGIVRVKLDR